jgi:hypothetical protein
MTPNGFDRLARPYRWMEYLTFGPALHRCRTHFLPRLHNIRNVLVLGDGDGRFTAQLMRQIPQARVTAIDASSRMLAQLQSRCASHTQRLTTHQANLPAALPPLIANQTYDLVATHFFLDCLTTEEVKQLATTIRPHLSANALWVVSDFAIPGGLLHRPAALVVAALYRSFRILTGLQTQRLPQHADAFAHSDFQQIQQNKVLGGLLVSELWQPVIKSKTEQ